MVRIPDQPPERIPLLISVAASNKSRGFLRDKLLIHVKFIVNEFFLLFQAKIMPSLSGPRNEPR